MFGYRFSKLMKCKSLISNAVFLIIINIIRK